jgi:hypothetical protein
MFFLEQIKALASFIDSVFGNMALTLSRMAAAIMGIQLPPKEVIRQANLIHS